MGGEWRPLPGAVQWWGWGAHRERECMGSVESTGCLQSLEFWVKEFERRMALATPAETVRGLLFKGTLESIRSLGDESLVQRCLAACGQERLLDFFSYPIRLRLQVILTALPTLAERYGGCEGALRQLGRRATSDFLKSNAGERILLMAQGSPKQLISRLPAAYRLATSFGAHEVEWTGLKSGRIRFQHEFMPPPFHEGVVQMGLETVGAQAVQVRGQQTGALDTECTFSWE